MSITSNATTKLNDVSEKLTALIKSMQTLTSAPSVDAIKATGSNAIELSKSALGATSFIMMPGIGDQLTEGDINTVLNIQEGIKEIIPKLGHRNVSQFDWITLFTAYHMTNDLMKAVISALQPNRPEASDKIRANQSTIESGIQNPPPSTISA